VPALVKYEFRSTTFIWAPVLSCTHRLRPRNSPPPPHLGSYTRALLVSQDRLHLFVTHIPQHPSVWPSQAMFWLKDRLHLFVTPLGASLHCFIFFLMCRYMIEHGIHEQDYLGICKNYRCVYDTNTIQEDKVGKRTSFKGSATVFPGETDAIVRKCWIVILFCTFCGDMVSRLHFVAS
jgi:hypothetical protein